MADGQKVANIRPFYRALLLGLLVWYVSQMLAGPLIMAAWVALHLPCTYGCIVMSFGLPFVGGAITCALCWWRGAVRSARQTPPATA